MDKGTQSSVQQCLLCNQPYSSRHALNKGGRVPLVLQCGHSACDSCISKAINKPGDSILCHKCNSLTTASDKYVYGKPELEFPYNWLILGQMVLKSHSLWEDEVIGFSAQRKARSHSSVTLCHECSEKKAELHCQECEVPYCEPCFTRIHQVAKAFKGHVRVNVLEAGLVLETKCSVHNELVQFWCEQCCLAICSNCLLASHKDHSVILLVEKNNGSKEELIQALTSVSNICTRLKSTRKNALASLPISESSNCKEVERSVREHFGRLHGILINRQKTLLTNLYSPTQDSANNFNSILRQIDHFLQELSGDLKMATVLVQNESKYINCVPYSDMLEKLKSRESTPCFLTVSTEQLDSTKFEFKESIYEELCKHGELDVADSIPRFKLVTQHQLPPHYTIDPIQPESLDSILKSFQEEGDGDVSDDGGRMSSKLSSLSLSSAELACTPSNFHVLPSEPPIFFFPPTSRPGQARRPPTASSHDSPTYFTELEEPINRTHSPLVKGYKMRVIMTHASSPSDFYVRSVGAEKKLNDINMAFSKLNLKLPMLEHIRPGDWYMARYNQDEKWYRSTVLSIQNNLVQVFYVDFGNTEFLPRDRLRLIPQSLMRYEGMALHCSLYDCVPIEHETWSEHATSTMIKICYGEMQMIVQKNTADLLHVDLFRSVKLDTICVSKCLVFLGLASHQNPKTHSFKDETVRYEKVVTEGVALAPGKVIDVLITHCVSPYQFYIQHPKNINAVKSLRSGLQEMYGKKSDHFIVQHPQLGMLVAAINSCENEWRRARIIGIPDLKKVKVLYVDFGDSEVISYKRTRHLARKFFNTPIQCTECQLSDVEPVGGGEEWDKDAKETFASLIEFEVKEKIPFPGLYRARLRLVVVGSTTHPDPVDCILFKIELPRSININTALTQIAAQSTGPNSEILELDAKLISKIGNQVKNNKGVDEWRWLAPEETMCHLRDLLLSEMSTSSTSSLLNSATPSDSELRSGWSDSGSAVVEGMFDGYLSGTESCTLSSIEEEEFNIRGHSDVVGGQGETIKILVNIFRFVSPSEFYIMLAPLRPKIQQMKQKMQKFYSNANKRKLVAEVKRNCPYAVKHHQDDYWCRAFTLDLSENTVKVLLPDFGEIIEVSVGDVYELDKKFKKLKDGVNKCFLGGLKGPLEGDNWPLTTIDVIREYIDKNQNRIYITKLGLVKDNSLPAEILVKQEVAPNALKPSEISWISLNKMLIMRGLAIPDGTVDWEVECSDYPSVSKETESEPALFKGVLVSSLTSSDVKLEDLTRDIDEESQLCLSNVEEGSTSVLDRHPANSTSPRPDHHLTTSSQLNVCSPVPSLSAPKSWLPALPFFSLEFVANPTSVDANGSIFIQDFQRSMGPLKRIKDILELECRESLPISEREILSVGDTCVTCFHVDNKLYRSVVKEVNEKSYIVELVDYGKIKKVQSNELRKMAFATEIPIQGHFCKLKLKPNTIDGKWTIPVLDLIQNFVVEKHSLLKLQLDKFDDTYYIESCKLPSGQELTTELVVRGYGVWPDESSADIPPPQLDETCLGTSSSSSNDFKIVSIFRPKVNVEKISFRSPNLSKSIDRLNIEVQAVAPGSTDMIQFHIISSDDITVTESRKKYDDVFASIQRKASSQPLIKFPVVNDICCAQYSFDNYWYRAVILDIPDMNTVTVKYVDYGNIEQLPITKIREMDRAWMEVEIQLFKAKLHNIEVPPTESSWYIEEIRERLIEVLSDKTFTAVLFEREPVLSMELYNGGVLAYQELIDEGLLKLTYN